MKPIQIKHIVAAIGGTLLGGDENTFITAVCTDTRKILPDSLFVPLVGENFDAHDFIDDALSGGASFSLTSRKNSLGNKPLIYVPNTRRALGDLAEYYRSLFPIPLVAITGSVGKTTVKELTGAVLSSKMEVLKTAGNFNNEIGLPLTLFRLEECHQAAITEMGMSGFGEIDILAAMAKPDIAVMTNIGLSHIEKLGSQENIYKAKSEIFRHITPGGTVILNGDDPILCSHMDELNQRVITAGTNASCDFSARDIRSEADSLSFTALCGKEEAAVHLTFPGEHNVVNALLACAVGKEFGISLADCAKALGTYVPADRRMQLMNLGDITLINDCYNAAPASMAAALRVLKNREGRKIAVLGDIKELGEHTQSAHEEIGALCAQLSIDALFAFGESAIFMAEGAKKTGMDENTVFHFSEMDALNQALGTFITKGDTLLVKASRAMRLERVVEFLNEKA